MATLNAVSNKTQVVSIEKLTAMSKDERSKVSVVKIIPPSLGNNNDFGKVVIKRDHQTYEVAL